MFGYACRFSIDKDDKLPAEFQAAKFLITRGAGVKFSDSKRWYQLDDATKHAFLPEFSDDTHVEAVDVSSMDIVAQGLAALGQYKMGSVWISNSVCQYVRSV